MTEMNPLLAKVEHAAGVMSPYLARFGRWVADKAGGALVSQILGYLLLDRIFKKRKKVEDVALIRTKSVAISFSTPQPISTPITP